MLADPVAGSAKAEQPSPNLPWLPAATHARVASGRWFAAPTPDDLRLEAIKHQILTKLGLRNRPDVNRTLATVPRHLALETLYRAEAQTFRYPDKSRNEHENAYLAEFLYGDDDYSYRNLDQQAESSTEDTAGIGYGDHEDQDAQEEMDDFYARTSEIITFAEPGESLFFFFFSLYFFFVPVPPFSRVPSSPHCSPNRSKSPHFSGKPENTRVHASPCLASPYLASPRVLRLDAGMNELLECRP